MPTLLLAVHQLRSAACFHPVLVAQSSISKAFFIINDARASRDACVRIVIYVFGPFAQFLTD